MSSEKRTPRPRPETLERRKRILRAAMTTFGSKGFNNGPLTEIAEQVDMTHAGILHHFGSKDQLLLEVLKFRDETDVEGLADQHIPDGIDLFRHLVRTAFANEQRPGIVQAYAVLSAESVTDDHPGRAYFQHRYETLRAEVATALRAVCAERGVTAPDDVDRAAASILAVMDGLQVQWLLAPDDVELARASEFAIEALVAAVVQPRPAVVAQTPASPSTPGRTTPTAASTES